MINSGTKRVRGIPFGSLLLGLVRPNYHDADVLGLCQRIITGIEKNQPRILIGNDARMMDLLQRFRPATYWAVLAKRIEKMSAKAK